MKKCFKCGIIKEISQFYKHKEMADGSLNKCKECARKDTANNDYDHTEKGVIRVMYKAQKANSKRRKMILPNYTKQEFKDWLYANNFKVLYDNWVLSGYKKEFKPSADRKNDFLPYSFDNLMLVTWNYNKAHQFNDILNGKNKGALRCKPVLQIDKDGNILAEYHSFSFARRIVGYSMESNIKNGKPSKKDGTFWRYK